MESLIVAGLAVTLLWAFVARRLGAWRFTGPLVLVAAGALVGGLVDSDLAENLDTGLAEKVVEIVLALLLFADATEVRGGFFGGERRIVSRLLLVALPLSLVVATATGLVLLAPLPWAAALAIACIVIPTDFAPASNLLRMGALPRVRHILNVESGYNDGIASPLFLFAIAVASGDAATPLLALESAVPAALIAVAIGAGIGGAAGYGMRRAVAARFSTPQSMRLAMVLIPLVTYFGASALDGNGFVAAFIAGIAYKATRLARNRHHGELAHTETSAVDDLGALTAMIVWFVTGAVAVLVFETGFQPTFIIFGLLALTLLRMVPVALSLIGTDLNWRERTLIGMLGPRGTASIVFGLLAYNALDGQPAETALYVTTVVVIGSILLHGILAPGLVHRMLGDRRTPG